MGTYSRRLANYNYKPREYICPQPRTRMAAILALKRALVPWSNPSAYATNLWLCLCEYALVNAALTRRRRPARPVLIKQVRASLVAAPAYALLPTAVEWLAARGATRLHTGAPGLFETLAFLSAVEVLVYCIHRALHEVPWLYRTIHRPHHEYKTREQLSPFASMAFHPLDGLAQASPYALLALVMPCHLGVWELLLFATGVWSSSIHTGATVARVPWLLGAAHHTLHHTHFRCNYGYLTTACDWAGATLRPPGRASAE
jgi:Delta7-sterol 5-desaturase